MLNMERHGHTIFDHNVEEIPFTYELGDTFYQSSNGLQPCPTRKAIYRSDTGAFLHHVSRRYNIVQPEQMREFYNTVASNHDLELINFKAVKGGKVLVGIAKMDVETNLLGDMHQNYLIFYTAVDGTSATRCMITSVRMSCTNALEIATGKASILIRVPHSKQFDPNQVVIEMGLVDQTLQNYYDQLETLCNTPITPRMQQQFFMELCGIDTVDEIPEHQGTLYHRFTQAVHENPDWECDATRNTLYGLVNGVTYAVDHKTKARDIVNHSLLGQGKAMKNKALNLAIKYAEAA